MSLSEQPIRNRGKNGNRRVIISANARTERQPPKVKVERTRRSRTVVRLRAEKRGGCSLQ